MKNLMDVLDGFACSSEEEQILNDAEAVIMLAAAGGMDISNDMAESIIRVGKIWRQEREHGNGEWSRMRYEAAQKLVCYMHEHSGDVASREMWEDDFKRMDVESWFGKEAEDCVDLHWLDDAPWLIEVEWEKKLWRESSWGRGND